MQQYSFFRDLGPVRIRTWRTGDRICILVTMHGCTRKRYISVEQWERMTTGDATRLVRELIAA